MAISKADVAMLGRRAHQPVKAPGELLAIWVSGRLKNPLNAGWGAAKWEHGYRQRWKQAVALALFEAQSVPRGGPKRVAFLANVHNLMDSDGLQAALKPVRDALVECGVISGDAEKDGHEFYYDQQIKRDLRGVAIHIRLRSAP